VGVAWRRHARWAATVWTVDGKAVLAKVGRHGPTVGPSPIAGAPNGVHVTAGADGRAAAEVLVASLPAGRYHLDGEVERDEARTHADPRGARGELRLTSPMPPARTPRRSHRACAPGAAPPSTRALPTRAARALLALVEGPAPAGSVWISTSRDRTRLARCTSAAHQPTESSGKAAKRNEQT